MSTKRDLAAETRDWIRREKSRAELCRSQIADLERKAKDSEKRAELLEEMLLASGYADAPLLDEDVPF